MSIVDKKIATFTKDVSDLPDKPSGSGMSAAEIKVQFDAAPNELKDALNGVIDILLSAVSGDSGAENIGSAVIPGVNGATVYAQLMDIKTQLNGLVLGQIPNASLTPSKLDQNTQSKLALSSIYAYKNLGGM